jgi:hypothetical protein
MTTTGKNMTLGLKILFSLCIFFLSPDTTTVSDEIRLFEKYTLLLSQLHFTKDLLTVLNSEPLKYHPALASCSK